MVTTHLRNQILAAIGHAISAHKSNGPMAMENAITDAVVKTIEAHAACTYCNAEKSA